ncbi:ArsR family transcriptional regulator [Streptomyces griseorubiginosus]|uniref:ArsR family transcriptional regulator n=1 Tax=Streptomyces griseorubiginosus TaxID=67304 RepID=UPI0015E85600|nr:ArsR family transcriptional regulator [Streptomyces griseorubiginosus]
MERAEELRRLSAGVFGNRYRAELITALADAGDTGVCLGDLALARQVPASVYLPPAHTLITLGLVQRVPPVPGERRRFYRRCGSAQAWQSLAAAVTRLQEHQAPPSAA